MADRAPSERLQPSLLDRITDNEPGKTQESRDQRVLSARQIRESVLRDLGWLLNTDCLETSADLTDYPEVARSVLNYGLPDLAGQVATSVDSIALERAIRRAITDFEPRILRDTMDVHAKLDEERMSHNVLTLEIHGDLWAQPLPLQLYLRTEIDLEAGSIRLADNG